MCVYLCVCVCVCVCVCMTETYTHICTDASDHTQCVCDRMRPCICVCKAISERERECVCVCVYVCVCACVLVVRTAEDRRVLCNSMKALDRPGHSSSQITRCYCSIMALKLGSGQDIRHRGAARLALIPQQEDGGYSGGEGGGRERERLNHARAEH